MRQVKGPLAVGEAAPWPSAIFFLRCLAYSLTLPSRPNKDHPHAVRGQQIVDEQLSSLNTAAFHAMLFAWCGEQLEAAVRCPFFLT